MKVSERLLALIQEIELRSGQTGEQLAEKFGCSKRTILRDIHERLPELGVVAVNQNGYRFLIKPHLRALALTQEELVSIVLAQKVAQPHLDQATTTALDKVVGKIRRGLSSWERDAAQRLEERTAVNPSLETESDTAGALFFELTKAVTNQERVTFLYQGRDDQAKEERYVEPLGLFFQERRWYLQAFDLKRNGSRTFRLARMSSLRLTQETFQPRENFSADSVKFHQYDIADAKPITLHLQLNEKLSRWFQENKPHPSTDVQGTKATVTVSDPKAFLRWFASLDEAEVTAPPEYVDWFVERLEKMQKNYQRGVTVSVTSPS